jgi:AAA ATPase domain
MAPSFAEAPERFRFEWLFAEHALFGGRDEELGQLDRFAEKGGGYLFVSAPSGFGKTALLVNWVRELDVKGYGLAYAFVNRLAGHAGEDVILRALCQQLATIHGETDPLPTSTSPLRALYLRLLTTAPAAGKRVVVVLDGLDEADGWEPKPDLFPPRLPEGVAVVFSAREIAERDWLGMLGFRSWHATIGLDRREVKGLRLTTLGEAEIDRLLLAAGEQIPVWARAPKALATMHAISAGDPFYVRGLVDDLLPDEQGRARIESFDELGRQPSGLEDYLDRWWEEVRHARKGAGELGQAVRDLFGYLLVAKGPLTRDDLVTASDEDSIDEWTLDDLVALVRRHVAGSGDGLTLSHPRFQAYLVERRFTDLTQRPYRARLLAYCSRWAEHGSLYALNHYADHLAEAGRWEELLAAARDPALETAQRERLQEEPGAPIKTAEYALSAAMDSDDPPAMAEFALLKARRIAKARADTSPLEILRSAGLQAAWKSADLYDLDRLTLWHLLLAWEAQVLGRDEDARSTLARLGQKSLTRVGDYTFRPLFLHALDIDRTAFLDLQQRLLNDDDRASLVEELASQADVEGAITILAKVRDARARATALSAVALCQADAGDFDTALTTAEEINDETKRASALASIASKQIGVLLSAGDLAGAARAADAIEASRERSLAYAYVAATEAETGDADAARQRLGVALVTAADISDEIERANAYATIAFVYSMLGEPEPAREGFAAALRSAWEIEYEYQRGQALAAVARWQAAAHDFVAALETSRSIAHEERWAALADVAVEQAESGEREAARETFAEALRTTFATDSESSRHMAAVARRQAGLGEMEWARVTFARTFETASAITDESERAGTFAAIAMEQAGAGDEQGARESYAAALRSAHRSRIESAGARISQSLDRIKERLDRDDLLAEVAQRQLGAGDDAAALATAKRIGFENKRAEVLATIAIEQARSGKTALAEASFSAAVNTAREVEGDEARARVFARIAARQASVGEGAGARTGFAEALTIAQGIAEEWERARALAAIAAAYAVVGDTSAAERILQQIVGAENRANALVEVAEAHAEVGAHEAARAAFAAALGTARDLPNEAARARTLLTVASAQARVGDTEGSCLNATVAQATAERIEDEQERANLLAGIAKTYAEAGEVTSAQEAAGKIRDEEARARGLGEVAAVLAASGQGDLAVQIVESLSTNGGDGRRSVAEALAKAGDTEHFKSVLSSCADDPDNMPRIPGWLGRLYPDDEDAIAAVAHAFGINFVPATSDTKPHARRLYGCRRVTSI